MSTTKQKGDRTSKSNGSMTPTVIKHLERFLSAGASVTQALGGLHAFDLHVSRSCFDQWLNRTDINPLDELPFEITNKERFLQWQGSKRCIAEQTEYNMLKSENQLTEDQLVTDISTTNNYLNREAKKEVKKIRIEQTADELTKKQIELLDKYILDEEAIN